MRKDQDISNSILFNAANWARIFANKYATRRLNEDVFEKYNIDDFELFLTREDKSFKFSNMSKINFERLYVLFDRELKKLLTSYITSKKSIQERSIIDKQEDFDIIDDFDTILDSDNIDEQDDSDITDDFDTILDFDITDDYNITFDFDATDDFDTTLDFDIIDDFDTTL